MTPRRPVDWLLELRYTNDGCFFVELRIDGRLIHQSDASLDDVLVDRWIEAIVGQWRPDRPQAAA